MISARRQAPPRQTKISVNFSPSKLLTAMTAAIAKKPDSTMRRPYLNCPRRKLSGQPTPQTPPSITRGRRPRGEFPPITPSIVCNEFVIAPTPVSIFDNRIAHRSIHNTSTAASPTKTSPILFTRRWPVRDLASSLPSEKRLSRSSTARRKQSSFVAPGRDHRNPFCASF